MKKLLASLPVIAWLVSVSLTLYLGWLLDLAGATVLVPAVSISDSAGSDVVSDVTAFAIVLGWGLICALMVEPTKAAAHWGRRPIAVYSLLVACQIALVTDTLRAHTSDWWSWLLSLLDVVTLKPAAEVERVASFRFPWISCVIAVATSFAVFRSFANGSRKTGAIMTNAPELNPPPTLPRERTSSG